MEPTQFVRPTPVGSLTYWLPLAQARFTQFLAEPSLKFEDFQNEFCALAEIARLARHHWNLIVPVARLPEEIMRHIFDLLKHEHHEAFLSSMDCKTSRKAQALAWAQRAQFFSATHVCQRWRQIALNMSSFWDTVHLGVPPAYGALLDILARSNDRMLDIEAFSGDFGESHLSHPSPAQLFHLAGFTHRLQRLTVDHYPATQAASNLSLPPLTAVESLSIITPDFLSSSFGELSLSDLDISERIPKLKHLRVHGIHLRGTPATTFEHLTSFHFSADVRHGSFHSWHQSTSLLDVLIAMPHLENLHITNAFPSLAYDELIQPVYLPVSMKTITLEALEDDCALQCIKFSQMLLHNSARRHVFIALPIYELEHAKTFFEAYLGPSQAPQHVAIEFNSLKPTCRISARYGHCSRAHADEIPFDFSADLDIRYYDARRGSNPLMEALSLVCDSVYVDDLTSIELRGAADYVSDPETLTSAWEKLGGRQVTAVSCTGALAATALIRVLERQEAEGATARYPRLERLHFPRCSSKADPVMYDLGYLLLYARARLARRNPICNILLGEGTVERGLLEQLREVVGDVAYV